MEGKFVIVMSAVLVVLGQIHEVESTTVCCPDYSSRAIYATCRFAMSQPESTCAPRAGCQILSGWQTCPPGWNSVSLQNTPSANEYCKSGCVSSVCAAITTLQAQRHSDASEVVINGAVEKCSNACSAFCTNKAASVITTAANA